MNLSTHKSALDKIMVFSDGACSGNPGPGGYGVVVVLPNGQVYERGGGDKETTNNRMELEGAFVGLRSLFALKREEKVGPQNGIWVLTDSTYVIRGITQWIWGWMKRGWKTAEGKEVKNADLWKKLLPVVQDLEEFFGKIEWKYLRGHSGTPGNERCDEIAVAFSKGQYEPLYKGDLIKYSVPIHDLPEDLSLPKEKSPAERAKSKKAFSYLSYVGGKLERHKTWSECEARVKGRRGAKFKKSTSSENEKEIVKSWGLNPDQLP